MKKLEPVDEKLKPEIEDILDRLKQGEDVDLSPLPEEVVETTVRCVTSRMKCCTQ